nr:unnamed protein product [Spirometra erinaceieuropaei]
MIIRLRECFFENSQTTAARLRGTMRPLKGKSKPPDDGWKEHGGYMQAKLRKLEGQNSPVEAPLSNIFAGVRIYVNGYTVPSADVLHRLVQQHGGSFTNYFSKSAGDFMIATNLAQSKVKSITDHKIVKPAWITASIQSGKLLSWRNFELYPTGTRKHKRKCLRQVSGGFLKEARFSVEPSSIPASPDGTKPSPTMDHSAPADVTSPSKSVPVQARLDFFVRGPSVSPQQATLSPRSRPDAEPSLRLGRLLRTGSTPTKEIPSADVLHRLVQQHGGSFTNYFSKSAGDFMIATNLAQSKVKSITDHKIVKPAWITASIQSGKLLSWRNFELYPTGTRKHKRKCLRQVSGGFLKEARFSVEPSSIPASPDGTKTSPSMDHSATADVTSPSKSVPVQARLDFFVRGPSVSPQQATLSPRSRPDAEPSLRLGRLLRTGSTPTKESSSATEGAAILTPSTSSPTKKAASTSSVVEPPVASISTSTHSGPGNYIATFYARSRLHHLSTWASDLRDLVRSLRGTLPDTAAGSFSEVASCSYEARKFGIKNGMHLGDARKLCPELKTVPYDFDAFRSVSEQLYKIVACFSLNIEAVSCDEMYVDLTDLLSSETYSSEAAEPSRIINPFLLGRELRRRVFEATGCTATCGFGTNRLLTRLATAKAKPNNQAFLIGASTHCAGVGNKSSPVDVVWHRAEAGGTDETSDCPIYEMDGEGRNYLDSLPISSLPGIGRSTAQRLLTKEVSTCGDLRQKLSLPQLSNLLGAKTGKRLYQLCQGKDSSDLMFDRFAKSVSAEINYGVRLASWPEVQDFVSSLASELATRMEHAATDADGHLGVLGRTLVVRLLTRRADQPKEAIKFMGHGICDAWTRTVQLPSPTRDVSLITSQCMSVLRRIDPDPTDIRGMGLQMQRLSPGRKLKRSPMEIALPTVAKSGSTCNAGASPPTDQPKPCSSSTHIDFSVIDDKKDKPSPSISTPSAPVSSTVVDVTFSRTRVSTSRNSEDEAAFRSPVAVATPQLSIGSMVSSTSTPMHPTKPPAVKISPVKVTPSPQKSPSPSRARPEALLRQTSPTKESMCPRPPPMTNDQVAADGASVFAKRSVEEIRGILTAWVSGVSAPGEEDVCMLSEYLASIVPTNLVRVRDILADLQNLLTCHLPATATKGSAADLWYTAFARIKEVVDRTCKVHFGANCLSISR